MMSVSVRWCTALRVLEHVGRLAAMVSRWLGCIALLAMLGLTVVDVAGRALFNAPLLVSVELSGYALVALVFCGLAYGEAQGRHIVITMGIDRLPAKMRTYLLLLVTICTAVVSAYLTWFTLQPAALDYWFGTVSLTGSGVPAWLPEALIPFGFMILSLKLVARTLEALLDAVNVADEK